MRLGMVLSLRVAVVVGVLLSGFPSQVLAEEPLEGESSGGELAELAVDESSEGDPSAGFVDDFVHVDVGRFNCGVRASGLVECWGDYGDYGWDLPLGDDFTMVSVGENHACGLRGAGEIECWGGWEWRNLGWGYGGGSPPQGLFRSVSVGRWHACGLRLDGEAECWGVYSAHGMPPRYYDGIRIPEAPGGEFADVQVSGDFACGLRPGGEVECWGQRHPTSEHGDWGASNLEESMAIWAALDAARARELEKRPAGPKGAYVEIAVGDEHACGLLASGEVECWHVCSGFVAGWVSCGPISSGELRSAIDVDRLPEGEFVSISAGGNETCGIRPGGRVECWNTCSLLGHLGLFVSEDHDWIVRDCERSFEHYSSFSPSGEFASVATYQYLVHVGYRSEVDTNQFNGCGILVGGGVVCWGFPPPDTECEVMHRSWWGEECSPGFPVRSYAVTPPPLLGGLRRWSLLGGCHAGCEQTGGWSAGGTRARAWKPNGLDAAGLQRSTGV